MHGVQRASFSGKVIYEQGDILRERGEKWKAYKIFPTELPYGAVPYLNKIFLLYIKIPQSLIAYFSF